MSIVFLLGYLTTNVFTALNLKKRDNSVLALGLFIFVLTYHAFTKYSDYFVYERGYDLVGSVNTSLYDVLFKNAIATLYFERGYVIVMYISNAIGLSYKAFLFTMALTGYCLMFKTIKRYTQKYDVVVLVYSLSIFPLYAILNRNFIVMSLFIYALPQLQNGRRGLFKYCIIMLVGTLFHNLAFLFLLYPIFYKRKNWHVLLGNIAIIFASLLTLTNVFGSLNKDMADLVYKYLKNDRLDYYLTQEVHYGFLAPLAIIVLYQFSACYLIKPQTSELLYDNSEEYFGSSNIDQITDRLEDRQFLINASFGFINFSKIMLILCTMQTVFVRIMLNGLPILAIFAAFELQHCQPDSQRKKNIMLFIVLISICIGFLSIFFFFRQEYYIRFFASVFS